MSQSSSPDTDDKGKTAGTTVPPFSRSDINAPRHSDAETTKHPGDKRAARGVRPVRPRAAAAAAAAKRREALQDQPAPRPPVSAARFERRHLLLALSFILLVVVPTVLAGVYLWTKAEDQYVSTVGFSVRKEDAAPSIDVLGGLTQLAGGSTASDTDILYDFLRSEDIVSRIDAAVDLRGKFAKQWPNDWFFAYDPEGTIEDLTDHWQRQVKVLYDTTTQLITLRIAAYSPEDALAIAEATFEESSRTINRLSDIARDDATRFARDELAKARERLTETRQNLTAFRMRTQIVDPTADLAGQMGILNTLQASLAETLIELDTLRENASDSDQRVIQTEKKIEAIRNRIAEEREKFSASSEGPGGENYAELMAEYEKLSSELLFDQTAYQSAQAAYDTSLAEAQRQSRYLAAHIEPKLAESSLVPNRPYLLAVALGVLLLGWSILLLIYYSLRDRR